MEDKKLSLQWEIFVMDDSWYEIKSKILTENEIERNLVKDLINEFIITLDRWVELYCEEKI